MLTYVGDEKAGIGAVSDCANGVLLEHLSRIWCVDIGTANETIDITSQLKQHDANGYLAMEYSTNDRMIRYKRIKSHFFTDTFYLTKNAQLFCGHTCMQLFVSDKGFVYVVQMKLKGDFDWCSTCFNHGSFRGENI